MHLQSRPPHLDREQILVDARRAMEEVYRFLIRRCGSHALAEDLTSESVLAAVDRITAGEIDRITVAYVVGIARHKLVDHWRRAEREQRHLSLRLGTGDESVTDEPFEEGRAAAVLASLRPLHRAVLTLRYMDDLSVPATAEVLGRSVATTETLLMRAKRAFRDRYAELAQDSTEDDHG